jgi:thiol-disulfide isomerase/thioredoxin
MLAALTITGLSTAQVKPKVERPARPELVLVRFDAEWCKFCRRLAPTYDELRRRHATDPVLFVTLDLTDKASRRQAEYLAGSLKLDDAWTRNALAAGRMMLVSVRTGEIVSTMTSATTIDEAAKRLAEALRTTPAEGRPSSSQ